jgi:hypothetical protein
MQASTIYPHSTPATDQIHSTALPAHLCRDDLQEGHNGGKLAKVPGALIKPLIQATHAIEDARVQHRHNRMRNQLPSPPHSHLLQGRVEPQTL